MTLGECVAMANSARDAGEKTVLTNGCFDILHPGHLAYLQASADLGNRLIVAVNSDESVRALKGPGRPINSEVQRAEAIAALRFVDAVFVFPGPRLTNEILAIAPDFYTKAGDYTIDKLEPSERQSLESAGSSIRFMPFVEGHSTTSIVNNLRNRETSLANRLSFTETIEELAEALARSHTLAATVELVGKIIVGALKNGKQLITCGNGGSAADAMHLSEELVGRYRANRRALPSICLNSDPTSLTCIANDFGYNQVFSRGVSAFGKAGDIFVGFTTSGNSQNVIEAFREARSLGLVTVLVSGNTGGSAKGMCDHEVIVPSNNTARIQEIHTVVLHQWLEFIDGEFSKES